MSSIRTPGARRVEPTQCDPPLSLRHAVDLPCDCQSGSRNPPITEQIAETYGPFVRLGKSRPSGTLGMWNRPNGHGFLTSWEWSPKTDTVFLRGERQGRQTGQGPAISAREAL